MDHSHAPQQGTSKNVCPFLVWSDESGQRQCVALPDDPVTMSPGYMDRYCLQREHVTCSLFLRGERLVLTDAAPRDGVDEPAGTVLETEDSSAPMVRSRTPATGNEATRIHEDPEAEVQEDSETPKERAVPGKQLRQEAFDMEPVLGHATSPLSDPVIDSPTNWSTHAGPSLTVAGTADAHIVVRLFDWNTAIAETTASGEGTWSITLPEVAEGDHVYAVEAADTAGRLSGRSTMVNLTVRAVSTPSSPHDGIKRTSHARPSNGGGIGKKLLGRFGRQPVREQVTREITDEGRGYSFYQSPDLQASLDTVGDPEAPRARSAEEVPQAEDAETAKSSPEVPLPRAGTPTNGKTHQLSVVRSRDRRPKVTLSLDPRLLPREAEPVIDRRDLDATPVLRHQQHTSSVEVGSPTSPVARAVPGDVLDVLLESGPARGSQAAPAEIEAVPHTVVPRMAQERLEAPSDHPRVTAPGEIHVELNGSDDGVEDLPLEVHLVPPDSTATGTQKQRREIAAQDMVVSRPAHIAGALTAGQAQPMAREEAPRTVAIGVSGDMGERTLSPVATGRSRMLWKKTGSVVAVGVVLAATILVLHQIAWSLDQTAGSSTLGTPVRVKHRIVSPAASQTRGAAPPTVSRQGSAHVLAAGASSTNRGRAAGSSLLVSAHATWYFPPVSRPSDTVIVMISNPNSSALDVAVSFPGAHDGARVRVNIPAHTSGEVNLSSEVPKHAAGALSLSAGGPVLVQRWAVGRTRTTIASATPVTVPTPRSARQPAVPSLAATLDADLKLYERRDGFSGAVLISKHGRIILAHGYGLADRAQQVAIQPQTAFPIRGLTSNFTAVAIMQLQDRHQLSVHDPMCRYLPGCPVRLRGITIEHLLTATSGLPHPKIDVTKPFGEAALMAAFGSTPPAFKPGTQWKASDTGYVLLGFIIEKVSGLPYRRYIHDHILAPLGMTASGFIAGSPHPALPVGYHGSRVQTRVAGPSYDPAWGMYSTVGDLDKLNVALQRSTLLSPAATSAMFAAHVHFAGGVGYGYDWTTGRFHGQPFTSTNAGGSPGYVGVDARLPTDNAEIIILSNQDRTSMVNVTTGLANDLLKGP